MINLTHGSPQTGGLSHEATLKQALHVRLELMVGSSVKKICIRMRRLIPPGPDDDGGPWHLRGVHSHLVHSIL